MPEPLRIPLLLTVLLASLGGVTGGENVDLHDETPRWIEARFLQSLPQEGASYSPPIRCWLEPGPGRGQMTMSVPAHQVEQVLFAGEGAVAGSFEDFVWIFEQATGHVVEAGLSGTLRRPLRIGWIDSAVDVDVTIRLSTLRSGGYRAPKQLGGRVVSEFCTDSSEGCSHVEPRPYDPGHGSVTAVGNARAIVGAFRWSSFVSLGHAVLRELRVGSEAGSDRDTPSRPRPQGSRAARPATDTAPPVSLAAGS